MHDAAAWIFSATYCGVAVGGVPGLVLDRTGIALIGAIAMVAAGVLTTSEAVASIHVPTILLLYALMVVSSQFRLGGLYTRVALEITKLLGRPVRFFLVLMAVSAALSALLTNDIICLAFTPVLAAGLLQAGLNPAPFLLGLAAASNIGSAATIIGNPQNMLIGQTGKLDFGRFLLWCGPPALVSLGCATAIILAVYRRDFLVRPSESGQPSGDWPVYDAHQSGKGIAAVLVLVGLFFTPVPREISAISIAGLLLCSRKMHTRQILGHVDWHLITLFCGLFIVVKGIEVAGTPQLVVQQLGAAGIDMRETVPLAVSSTLLSNIVSNVPAVMILTKFLSPSDTAAWHLLALTSTFAGNLITIGSIANLITIEQAREQGIRIGFLEHARTGVPITAASLLVTLLWAPLARILGF
ncbi:MAG: SLC13 family permease [Thermodesulfovibrionales bacterium]